MYSTRCTSCGQLIQMKTEEIQAAISEAEAAGHTTYQMPCPKCRRPVKMTVKALKLKLPRAVPESLDGRGDGQDEA
ncbi:MAG TPA: hypothetical protein PLD47_15640 [Aggregatilineales bacterium]|nr:hypothetical protein [Anaerolineales bacterium]HRE49161.1 hypothetical protein [Aggregatilineales bacterium]